MLWAAVYCTCFRTVDSTCRRLLLQSHSRKLFLALSLLCMRFQRGMRGGVCSKGVHSVVCRESRFNRCGSVFASLFLRRAAECLGGLHSPSAASSACHGQDVIASQRVVLFCSIDRLLTWWREKERDGRYDGAMSRRLRLGDRERRTANQGPGV